MGRITKEKSADKAPAGKAEATPFDLDSLIRFRLREAIEEILVGPAHENDGRRNLFGGLRGSMATTGYATVKAFQKAEVMIAPSLQTEGKQLQRSQGVGMG